MLFFSLVILILIHSIYSLDNGLGKTPQMGLFKEDFLVANKNKFFLIRME